MAQDLKNFKEEFSEALGPGAKEIIAEDHETIKEQRQRLTENSLRPLPQKRKMKNLKCKILWEK